MDIEHLIVLRNIAGGTAFERHQEFFFFPPLPEKVPAVSTSLIEMRLFPYGQLPKFI
jgi:hypothetical protein